MDTTFTQAHSTPTLQLENTVQKLYGKLLADTRTRYLLRNIRKERYCWQQLTWLEHCFPTRTDCSALTIRQAYQRLLGQMRLDHTTSRAFLEHLDASLWEQDYTPAPV